MSDCSKNAYQSPKPIHGEIVWKDGMRPTPLSYARYVNGVERVADHIDFDGERYERISYCELEHHDTGWVSCRECNTSWKNDRPHVYRRCPYCGARVRGGGDD